MRARRVLHVILVTATLSLAGSVAPLPRATANGGAYLELDRTHYLPGQTAVARGFVSVPEPRRVLFDRGPFWLFLVPRDSALHEGRPIPAGARRLSAVSIAHVQGPTFRLSASFTVPDLPGAFYGIGLCNDPCTISGFREPLTGTISIVRTAREASLLNETTRLRNHLYVARRQLRKAERAVEELQASFDQGVTDRAWLADRVNRLNAELAAAQARTATADGNRPVVDVWAALAIVGALLVLATVIWRRGGGRRVHVPDTIAELAPERAITER